MNKEIRTTPRLLERVLAYVRGRHPHQIRLLVGDGEITVQWDEGRLRRAGEPFWHHGIRIEGAEVQS